MTISVKALRLVFSFVLALPAVAAAAGSGSGSGRAAAKAQKTFDHSAFGALLRAHVRAGGSVDYEGLAKRRGQLDRYVRRLARAKLNELNRSEQMALWINAYNAFTIQAVLGRYPQLKSIRDIRGVWKRRIYSVAGGLYSLGEIEREVLRKQFGDARIHFAINCASAGCPVLRGEAYTGAKLETQLNRAARTFLNSRRGMRLRIEAGRGGKKVLIVELSQIFRWYRDDFPAGGAGLVGYVKRYASGENQKLLDRYGNSARITFFRYDWSLNKARKSMAGARGSGKEH